MQVNNSVQIASRNVIKKSNIAFRANSTTNAREMFDEYSPKKLPENKAIKIVRRPGAVNLLNILTIPFGIFGISTKNAYKLVDIDPNNLSQKEQKLIRTGKMIDFVPAGYHIENDKVVKNK